MNISQNQSMHLKLTELIPLIKDGRLYFGLLVIKYMISAATSFACFLLLPKPSHDKDPTEA